MVLAYYNRLSASRRRTYRKSDTLRSLPLPPNVSPAEVLARLALALKHDRRMETQSACQELIDQLARGYAVPPIRVSVLAARPSNDYGELHGYYEPLEENKLAHISVWMRTAQRKQVVAFKTFLRTLIHELCHHLDYELFLLPETFHTEGFYKRESSLANALLEQMTPPEAVGKAAENMSARAEALELARRLSRTTRP